MKQITNMRQDVHRDWLREMRVERGETLQQVAKVLGITTNYLGDIEHGRRNPSSTLALKLARYFDFEVERIIKDAIPVVHKYRERAKAEKQKQTV